MTNKILLTNIAGIPVVGLILFLISLFSLNTCFATEYDDFFQQASAAYQAGDYGKAVILFKKAKQADPKNSRAIDFNVGSSLYKWGKYIAAYEAFESSSEDPHYYVLSQINMALCAAKLDDKDLLAKHLLIVAPLVKSERYRQQLNNIAQPFGLQSLLIKPVSHVNVNFDFSLGRQTNINLQLIAPNLSGANINNADANFTYSQLQIQREWSPTLSLWFSLQDMAFQTSNAVVRNNNYRVFTVSPRYRFRSAISDVSLNFSAVHTDIADRSFQTQAVIQANALYIHNNWRNGVYFQQRSLYSTDKSYRYLQGREVSLGYMSVRNTSQSVNKFQLGVIRNNREDYYDTSGTVLLESYSPTIINAQLDTNYRVRTRLTAHASLLYRVETYAAQQNLEKRRDRRQGISLGLTQEMNHDWSLLLNYQAYFLNSTQSKYEYDSRLLMLGTRYHW